MFSVRPLRRIQFEYKESRILPLTEKTTQLMFRKLSLPLTNPKLVVLFLDRFWLLVHPTWWLVSSTKWQLSPIIVFFHHHCNFWQIYLLGVSAVKVSAKFQHISFSVDAHLISQIISEFPKQSNLVKQRHVEDKSQIFKVFYENLNLKKITGLFLTSVSKTKSSKEVGWSHPEIMLKLVNFPAPLAPSNSKHSLSGIVKDKDDTATFFLYTFLNLRHKIANFANDVVTFKSSTTTSRCLSSSI